MLTQKTFLLSLTSKIELELVPSHHIYIQLFGWEYYKDWGKNKIS